MLTASSHTQNNPIELNGVGHVMPGASPQLRPATGALHASVRQQMREPVIAAIPVMAMPPAVTAAIPVMGPSRTVAFPQAPRFFPVLPGNTNPIPVNAHARPIRSAHPKGQSTNTFVALSRPTSTDNAAELQRLRAALGTQIHATATQVEALLLKGDLPAARDALETLGNGLAPERSSKVTAEILTALMEMAKYKPVLRAHLMGACHYFDNKNGYWSAWRKRLRHQEDSAADVSIAMVVEHGAKQLRDPATRVAALQAMMVHLSWLAPEWGMVGLGQTSHQKLMKTALTTLIHHLNEQRDMLTSDEERAALLEDVLQAIAPLHCSPSMGLILAKFKGIPTWLRPKLKTALQVVADGNGAELFPSEGNYTPANACETRLKNQAGSRAASERKRRAESNKGESGDGPSLPPRTDVADASLSARRVAPRRKPKSVREKSDTNISTPRPFATADCAAEARRTNDLIAVKVREAAASVENLLSDVGATSARRVFISVAESLEPPPNTAGSTTPEITLTLLQISKCTPVIRAHLMGACHYFSTEEGHALAWKSGSRYQAPKRKISFDAIVSRAELGHGDLEKRAQELKALFVHLSWVSPNWAEEHADYQLQPALLGQAVAKLMARLDAERARLTSDADKEAFANDIQKALVPSYCSPLLAIALGNAEDVPSWLQQTLQTARQAFAEGTGKAIFPPYTELGEALEEDAEAESDVQQQDLSDSDEDGEDSYAPSTAEKRSRETDDDTIERPSRRLRSHGPALIEEPLLNRPTSNGSPLQDPRPQTETPGTHVQFNIPASLHLLAKAASSAPRHTYAQPADDDLTQEDEEN